MPCTNCSQSGSSLSFDMQCFFNSGCPGCADNDCGNNIQNAHCVIYTGPNLPCSGIETNDSVELALQKIDEQICSVLGDYSTYQFHCLEEFFGDSITTEADFVSSITDYACTLRADFETFTDVTFVNYQTAVNTRFVAIEQPGITCSAAGVLSSDSLIDVLAKYCEELEDINEAISIDDVDWDQCFTVVGSPTTIEDAFSLLIDQICQVKDLIEAEEPTTINNTGSCIGGTAADTIPTTIELIKDRLCETPTFDKDDLAWSCLTPPTFSNDQDITSALQELIDLVVDLKTAIPTFDSGDFAVSQTNPMNTCDGVTVALQTTLDTDRFVAATALDGSPATLIDKLDAGTGISITNNADTTLIIANTAPDVPVVLTQGTGITITGTYPNFTISTTGGDTDTNFAEDNLTFTGDRLHNLAGFDCTLTAGTLLMDVSRFETDMGGNVTSTNNLTLGGDGNVFKVTGNTQINAILTSGWQEGSQIVLELTDAPTLKHNTAGGAGTAPMFLAGSVDFVAAAGDAIEFYYNGTHWHEIGRTLAAALTPNIYRNGLTQAPVGIIELGGTLLHNTTISSSTNTWRLNITGVTTALDDGMLHVSTIGSGGVAVKATTIDGRAVYGITTGSGGTAVYALDNGSTIFGRAILASSTEGTAIWARSYNYVPATFTAQPASSDTITTVIELVRSATGAAGVGGSMDYRTGTDANLEKLSTRLASKWVIPADATRTSQFDLSCVASGTTNLIMSAYGTGVVGIGVSSAYQADRLHVVNATNQNHTCTIQTVSNATTSNGLRGIENQVTLNVDGSTVFTAPYSYCAQSNGYTVSIGAAKSVNAAATNTAEINTIILAATTSNTLTNTPVGGSIRATTAQTNQVTVKNNGAAITPVFTHVAGMHVLPINYEVGTGQATITNYYGLLLGDAGSKGAVTTNKWGIYQEGTADTNFFAASVGIGATPSTTALLELTSTTKGFIVMRMTATEASAITPTDGMMLYVTNTNGTFVSIGFWGRENGVWVKL